MPRSAAGPAPRERPDGAVEPGLVLAALPDPVIVVDACNVILWVNAAAEQFLEASASSLAAKPLTELLPGDAPLFALIAAVRANGSSVAEYGVPLQTPRLGSRLVTIQAAPLPEEPGRIVIVLHEHSIAHKIDRQLVHRGAARSVSAMAAILAHEVKNPLSGIRGAAQLLEANAAPADRELTRLICEEADRIVALIERMDAFADAKPLDRAPVNIHEVLERVRRLAQAGFARHLRIVEDYDPSLPPVHGNRDLLVQVFLNLIKNAAEAAPAQGGEIGIATAFRPGIRLAVPSSDSRLRLPLVVSISDNGDGIPEDLRAHLFDPFVTSKRNGTGLGLALVAKVIGDHGGIVEFESEARRTIFRVMLPIVPGKGASER